MYGWIDPFYVAAEAALEPGHVWLGHPLRLPARQALKIDRVNPKDDAKLDFTLAEATRDALAHPPVHSLGLGIEEGAVLARAALDRPVVILGGTAAEQLGSDATAIVIPIAAAAGFDEPTRRRIAAYGFANAFYLPVSDRLPESYARLDQAQPVLRDRLGPHQGFKLSPDALDALVEWYVAFATGRQPEDSLIAEYRREAMG